MSKYNALDVADFIVDYCNKSSKSISHLQLQKILYFAEAHYLVNNSSLFKDSISKWRLGPVVESVYHEYKTFGSSSINYVPKRYSINPDGEISLTSFDPSAISEKDKRTIEKIVEKYINFQPFTLVKATHEHYPWKKDEIKINNGFQGLVYNKDELREYFEGNPNAFEVK